DSDWAFSCRHWDGRCGSGCRVDIASPTSRSAIGILPPYLATSFLESGVTIVPPACPLPWQRVRFVPYRLQHPPAARCTAAQHAAPIATTHCTHADQRVERAGCKRHGDECMETSDE